MRSQALQPHLRYVCSATLLFLLVIAPQSLHAAPAAQARSARATPPQVFLKINDTYILYTYPVVPFQDKATGTLMVGLPGIARAFRGGVTEGEAGISPGLNRSARSEELLLRRQESVFQAGSAVARVHGKPFRLNAAAVWDQASGHLIVPVVGLAQCMGLSYQWDPEQRVLSLAVPPTKDGVDNIGEFRLYPQQSDHTSVVPWRVIYHPSHSPQKWPWLQIEARNISDGYLDREALNIQVCYADGEVSENLELPDVPFGDLDSGPPLAPGQLRQFKLDVGSATRWVTSVPTATPPTTAVNAFSP